MTKYEDQALHELKEWQRKMIKEPSLLDVLSKGVQNKINNLIPERAHQVITVSIQKMVQSVLFGAKFITSKPLQEGTLELREMYVKQKIDSYRNTAVTEGAVTGAGGILLGLADFPILLTIKIKLLFEIASLYGYNVKDYKERLFILYVFQLAFSSQKRRNEVYRRIEEWDNYISTLPDQAEKFDWRTFQQEYRDYIDLAKLAQLVPIIGAAVGAIANYKLINLLGRTAVNSYRMRKFANYQMLDQ